MKAEKVCSMILCTAIAIVIGLTMSAELRAEEEIKDTVATKVMMYRDGTVKVHQYRWDNQANRFMRDVSSPADKRSFGSAVIERMYRWKQQGKKVVFRFTPDSFKFRSKVNSIFVKYLKNRRGVGSAPWPSKVNQKDQVRPLNQFNNIFEYQRQFQNDDKNNIVMTTDDLFFKNPFGILNDPDLIGYTWFLASASISQSGGKWRGTYYIEEADIFLRSDFFEFAKAVYEVVLTGLTRYGFGYGDNITVWDLNGENRTFSYAMFKNVKKTMWKKLAYEWDRLFYGSALNGPSANPAADKIYIIPGNDFVLDVADYEVPDTDAQNPDPTNRTSALFVTNLLAFNGGKKLTAKFTAMYPDPNNPKKTITKKIFSIANNAYDYPKTSGQIGTWYPTQWVNEIKFGRVGELNKLKSFIKKYGTELKIEGATFEKALKVEVKITGYQTENGGKKSKKSTVYFVNTDDE